MNLPWTGEPARPLTVVWMLATVSLTSVTAVVMLSMSVWVASRLVRLRTLGARLVATPWTSAMTPSRVDWTVGRSSAVRSPATAVPC